MSQKAVYQLSARQILVIAFLSALFAAGIAILISNYSSSWSRSSDVLAETNPPANLSNPDTVSDEQNSIEVYKTLSPGVAFITTSQRVQNWYGEQFEQESGNGSGSVIDNQGHILTNYHVVEGASKLTVSLGGNKVYPAKFVGGDASTDLAVIKIDPPQTGLITVPLGNSDNLIVGQKVLAIGNPFGLDRTLTTGVISGLQRPIRARNNRLIEGAIQTDASINPGNSGGPLLDKYGKMIGINSQILSPAGGSVGVGFAIPVNIAKRIIPQLLQYGEVRRPSVGANFYAVEDLAERGVRLPVSKGLLIRNLLSGGAAEKAGLKGLSQDSQGDVVLGDIITSIDGEEVSNLDDLYRLLEKKQIGATVQAKVFRSGKEITVPLILTTSSQNNQTRPTRRY